MKSSWTHSAADIQSWNFLSKVCFLFVCLTFVFWGFSNATSSRLHTEIPHHQPYNSSPMSRQTHWFFLLSLNWPHVSPQKVQSVFLSRWKCEINPSDLDLLAHHYNNYHCLFFLSFFWNCALLVPERMMFSFILPLHKVLQPAKMTRSSSVCHSLLQITLSIYTTALSITASPALRVAVVMEPFASWR